MADTKISALTDGTTAEATDRLAVARDPTGTPLSRYITPAYIKTYLNGLAHTWTGANVFSPASNTLEQYNGTTAQEFRVYNTRTDASNYEYGFIRYVSNVLQIGHSAAGTGNGNRYIRIVAADRIELGTSSLYVDPSSGFIIENSRNVAFTGSGAGRVTWGTAGLSRSANGILNVDNASTGGAALEFREQTAPSAAAANAVRIYAVDNGSGKTQLMAIFATGAAQQLAIEP